jgi:hypothetical protein
LKVAVRESELRSQLVGQLSDHFVAVCGDYDARAINRHL